MLARAGFVVAVLTLVFAALTWAESSKWLPLWASVLTRPRAIVTALAVVIVLEAWAIMRLQTRLQARLTKLENRFESHDHNDLEWVAKVALKSKTGGMGVRQG
jgi:hypothetical protein